MEVFNMATNWMDKFGFNREEAPMGGIPTLQARQRVFNNNMEQDKFDWLKTFQEAGLTGMYDGNKTWGRTVDESNLTGMFEGNDTFAREKFNDSSALGWAGHALAKDRNALSRQQFDWNKAQAEAKARADADAKEAPTLQPIAVDYYANQTIPDPSQVTPKTLEEAYNWASGQVASGEWNEADMNAYMNAVNDKLLGIARSREREGNSTPTTISNPAIPKSNFYANNPLGR
jgi:hypothetical protein